MRPNKALLSFHMLHLFIFYQINLYSHILLLIKYIDLINNALIFGLMSVSYNQSRNTVVTKYCGPFFLKKYGYSSRKKSTLKLGEGGLRHNFYGWLSESQKLFWQGFTLQDAFKHFTISLQISFILFILPLQVPTKLTSKKTSVCSTVAVLPL